MPDRAAGRAGCRLAHEEEAVEPVRYSHASMGTVPSPEIRDQPIQRIEGGFPPALPKKFSEPDRAGSRISLRSVALPGAPRRAVSATPRHSLRIRRFPKLRVAGSIPVSRSTITVKTIPLVAR